jgi:hypothetical protein
LPGGHLEPFAVIIWTVEAVKRAWDNGIIEMEVGNMKTKELTEIAEALNQASGGALVKSTLGEG